MSQNYRNFFHAYAKLFDQFANFFKMCADEDGNNCKMLYSSVKQ